MGKRKNLRYQTFYGTSLFGRLLNGGGSVLDGGNHVVGVLLVDSAADTSAGTKDLQNGSRESLSERTGAHDLGDTDDVVESNVTRVLDVLLLLAISVGLLQGLNDQSGGGGHHLDLGLTVLNDKLNRNADSLPVLGGLGDIITDLLGGKTEGTDLGGKRGSSSSLTSNDTNGDYNLVSEVHPTDGTQNRTSQQTE